MILKFKCKETEKIFNRDVSRAFPSTIQVTALRKLNSLHFATDLMDLRNPPSNRLEALHGDRKGQYSIRVNDKYRVCFVWGDGNASEVEIVDYH